MEIGQWFHELGSGFVAQQRPFREYRRPEPRLSEIVPRGST